MRYRCLLLGVVLLGAACARVPVVVPPRAEADVSGRWIGTWKAPDVTHVGRQDTIDARFVQQGSHGRGKMVWSGVNTAALPEDVILAGALGVPVVFDVAGSVVQVRHEYGSRRLTAQLEVRGDEMVGRVVGTDAPVELRLVRQPGPRELSTAQRVDRLEADLDRERHQVADLLSRLAEFRSLAESTNATAEQASAAAHQALAKADAGHDGSAADVTSPRHGGSVIRALQVAFQFDRSDLDDAAETALLAVVDLLKQDAARLVELEGYTDSIGTLDYNLGLSQRRVNSVHRFLAKKGVPLAQIHLVGLGALPGNGSRDALAKNRRVTVSVLSGEPESTSTLDTTMSALEPIP
jgi:outer membrane protein OmpA-like peptidoglycan-associated protein